MSNVNFMTKMLFYRYIYILKRLESSRAMAQDSMMTSFLHNAHDMETSRLLLRIGASTLHA